MRIGIVDLDTSHPENWVPIERELGHEVVGVWDGGAVHPPGYAAEFARRFEIPRVFATLDEMVEVVDCAILHGCDWDTRIAKARPFAEAQCAVLIDKPLAGNLADLHQIRAWMRGGARITGGSALRYCDEVRNWLAQPLETRGAPHTILVGCAVDEFNYGIHAYSLLCAIMGVGVSTVRHLSEGAQRRIEITWHDGRVGFLIIGKVSAWLPFYATVVTDRTVAQLRIDQNQLYRALLQAAIPILSGDATALGDGFVDPELCALAARRSWLCGNAPVRLEELTANDRYDGAAFARSYRAARYATT